MKVKDNSPKQVRFFTNGGHDGGHGGLGHIDGVDVVVTPGRWDEIRQDASPMNTLRSPYGKPAANVEISEPAVVKPLVMGAHA